MTALTNSKLNQTDTRRQIPWLNVRILKKQGGWLCCISWQGW